MAKLVELSTERDALRAELDATREKLDHTTRLFEMLGETAQERAAEIERLRSAQQKLDAQYAQAVEELDAAQAEAREAHERASELDKELGRASKDARDLRSERDALRDELDRALTTPMLYEQMLYYPGHRRLKRSTGYVGHVVAHWESDPDRSVLRGCWRCADDSTSWERPIIEGFKGGGWELAGLLEAEWLRRHPKEEETET